MAFMETISSHSFVYIDKYIWSTWQWSWRIWLQFLARKLVLLMVKKSYYCSTLPPYRLEFEALRGFGLHLSNETLFVLSDDVLVKASWFSWQRQLLWFLPHFCPYSMDSPARGRAILVGSLGEIQCFCLKLEWRHFGGYGFFEEDVFGLESLDFWRRRWEVEMPHRAC